MAKPRIFVSSTYYDLKYIRAGIESFVSNLGYEPILFEKGDIPFHHDKSLEASCLHEVDTADILIMIIGGRYGSLSKDDEAKVKAKPDEYFGRIRSVTNKEYEKAFKRDIATFVFVEAGVYSEYRTFKENRENKSIRYAHVDDVRIYEMIDDIMSQARNNYVKDFSNIEDITNWLRDQWAGIFVDLIRRKNVNSQIKSLEEQISDLVDTIGTLKKYNEEIIRAVSKAKSTEIIAGESRRTRVLRARKLMKEDMISYIVRTQFDTSEKPTPVKTLDSLAKANNVEEFLQLIGLSIEETLSFMNAHSDQATLDFEKLKRRYVIEPAAEDE